jgi:hypothetical protein
MNKHRIARRTLIASAGLGIGAGLVSGLAGAQAQGAGDIWSQQYWARKGDVKLNLWRKRVGAPKPGEPTLPVLFLVHGSSLTAIRPMTIFSISSGNCRTAIASTRSCRTWRTARVLTKITNCCGMR